MKQVNSNALAGLLVAVYLFLIVIRGNTRPLINLLNNDAGFLKWAVAVLTISSLASIKEFKPLSSYIILFVSVGMLLEIERQGQSAVFFEQIQSLMRIKK